MSNSTIVTVGATAKIIIKYLQRKSPFSQQIFILKDSERVDVNYSRLCETDSSNVNLTAFCILLEESF